MELCAYPSRHTGAGRGSGGAGQPLTIITGAGHHSQGQRARIRPAVIDLLDKRGVRFYTTEGAVTVIAV